MGLVRLYEQCSAEHIIPLHLPEDERVPGQHACAPSGDVTGLELSVVSTAAIYEYESAVRQWLFHHIKL